MLFDTHAHLDQTEFDDCRDAVIARAQAAGVGRIITVGVSAASSEKCVALVSQYDSLLAAVGIQPNYVAEAAAGDWDQIVRLAADPGVVALGETGLDRYCDDAPFDLQQDFFDRHLRLSQQLDRPFVVHMRECQEEVLAMLREARTRGPLQGVMHSYTGDLSGALECVELGLYISFAGMATFKKSQPLRDCATAIPIERLLVETDSPYLSPEPLRGKRPNEPARVRHTAACLAAACGTTQEAFAAQTTSNACRLFRVD